MKKFAIIFTETDVVNSIMELEDEMPNPVFESFLEAIDCTSADPEPGTGWTYDRVTGEFSAP